MKFPDRIEMLYMLYWGSAYTSSWKNMYTDDLIKFFKYEMPEKYEVDIRQKLNSIKILNCNHRSQDYSNERSIIEILRPYKIRKCPLIVLNYNIASYSYHIDSDYMYKAFTQGFGETMQKQVYGK